MRIQPGQILHERWRIDHMLGEGGIGYVLVGEDLLLKRRVAIKSLRGYLASSQEVHTRFLTEAQVMARIDTPEVVSVYDAFDWQGLPVVVMEYVDGETLSSVLAHDPRPPRTLVRAVLEGVLRGLGAAHRAGLVHGDVKPDNIMVMPGEDGEVGVRLLGFGDAQLKRLRRHALACFVEGTARYMSPEQVRETSRVDARTDLFSAGAVLWEMLSGEAPWAQAEYEYELRLAASERSLPELPAQVPPELGELVRHLTQRDPGARPESAEAALRVLR